MMADEPAELRRATLPQVQAAAAKYAVPAEAGLLLVGDRAKIEPGIRSLKAGELLFLDVEGNPVAGSTAAKQ